MHEASGEDRHPAGRGLRISDMAGLVAGYGLASWLARPFWPSPAPRSPWTLLGMAFEYAWLGLAMSGPIVLLLGRVRSGGLRGATSDEPESSFRPEAAPGPRTEEPSGGRELSTPERAWMVIGAYWIALSLLVVPFRVGDAPWVAIGLFNLAIAIILLVTPRSGGNPRPGVAWTHRAAVAVLWTLPVAWVDLVFLASSAS